MCPNLLITTESSMNLLLISTKPDRLSKHDLVNVSIADFLNLTQVTAGAIHNQKVLDLNPALNSGAKIFCYLVSLTTLYDKGTST